MSNNIGTIVEFTPESVKEYLDNCISAWRESDHEAKQYYVDAYQSVRISLFGELLDKSVALCPRCRCQVKDGTAHEPFNGNQMFACTVRDL